MRRQSVLALGALGACCVLPLNVPAHADDEGDALRALLDRVAPSIVTLRLVVKQQMTVQGNTMPAQETRQELQAFVVADSGLLCTADGPFDAKTQDMGMVAIKNTIEDVKVVIEREDKRYDAFLVATDAKVHLAFIQIEGLGDRKLVPVDLEQAASPQVGDPVVGIARLDAGYDYTPFFRRGRVGGVLEKPRKAWVLDSAAGGAGLPVFTPAGAVVGVVSAVDSGVPEEEDDGAGGMMGMIRRMAQGSGISVGAPFVLPARTVRASAQQAVEKAKELIAERAAKKAEAEKKAAEGGEKKPDPPKKGDDY